VDMTNLSGAAKRALENALGTSIGAPTGAVGTVRQELIDAGMIGVNRGLTRQGSIVAMRLKRAQEEELFRL